jgi:UDP-glucose 4-epimerase
VSRHVGGVLARRLAADPAVDKVIGVDVIPPPRDIGRAEFIRADIRNPMIGKVIAQGDVDTVVHANVIGTMQLLAACQKASSVKRLVVKSTAAVYGSTPRDPAMFTEEMTAKRLPSSGFGKDSIEVEGYVRGFARRRPDAEILTLRFANIIGPRIRTSLTDYFNLPVIPVPFGFDARLQFLHEDDAIAALVRGVTGTATGVVNVAGDGVLTALQAAAIARRPVVMVPMAAAGPLGGLGKRLGLVDFSPDQMSFLAYGRGMDTTLMRESFGFTPAFTTRAAFEDFARTVSPLYPSLDAVGDAVGGIVGAAHQVLTRPARGAH